MKGTIILLSLILVPSLLTAQDSKTYGEGVMLWGAYDIMEQKVIGDLEKKADVISIEKVEGNYIIKCRDKGLFKITLTKLQGLDEDGKFTDNYGTVYYVKDYLDTKYKVLDMVSSKPLPDVPPNIFMTLQIYIK